MMPILNLISEQMEKNGLKTKVVLLVIQVVLPFGLYLALKAESGLLAALLAVPLLLSMALLMWLG